MDSREKQVNTTAEEQNTKIQEATQESKPVEVYVERGETTQEDFDQDLMKEAAAVYARYLKEKGLEPGAATFVDPEQLSVKLEAETQKDPAQTDKAKETDNKEVTEKVEQTEITEQPEKAEQPTKKEKKKKEKKEKKEKKKDKPVKEKKSKKSKKTKKAGNHKGRDYSLENILSAPIDMFDRLQGKVGVVASNMVRDFITESHNIVSIYKHSKRVIARGVLIMVLVSAFILVLFDKYTVYEYAYNGKVLGYVDDQEEVTDVLDVTGEKMSELKGNKEKVKFEAQDNITFSLVDAKDKSTDNSDAAVNKLVYMTDIETEAFGIYDGDKLVTIVESRGAAEKVLDQSMAILSTPDKGMELVSAEFTNTLDIQPINVLLSSVQSNNRAVTQMVKGGNVEFYHIVEEGETLGSLEKTFGVSAANIYDGDNKKVVTTLEQGDKICVRKEVEPISAKMVEEGKMRETVEFKTVKKNSKDYYKGDTHIQQEGVDGIQIFEGTVTKVGGEVTDRKTDNIEVIRKKKDKVILIGTAERPKTAPTGTFIVPPATFVISSYFGPRWGRMHTGIDMAAATGTPIYASDGGTVVRAEYYGGYGLCIDIDHGNGKSTRYGHCNELFVHAGDKVYQGQHIAAMGNTGRSFGSHLHFEIRVNGTPVNPLPILGL